MLKFVNKSHHILNILRLNPNLFISMNVYAVAEPLRTAGVHIRFHILLPNIRNVLNQHIQRQIHDLIKTEKQLVLCLFYSSSFHFMLYPFSSESKGKQAMIFISEFCDLT